MPAPTRPLAVLLLVAFAPAWVPADPPKAKANRLAGESSPYLLQHAHNPVDWFPWGPEAFAKAKKEGKLVFLSIGYSSCHWCHVMEKESFASADIAKVLNENFVCVKVDREERPDIDDVYMTALQTTGLSGGWPLTMFLTPEGKPIFGGTYFPPDDKKVGDDTSPGMKSVLKKVIDLHRDKQKELFEQADRIAELTTAEMNRAARGMAVVDLTADMVKDAAAEYELDPEHGGLSRKANGYRGTKFPRVAALLFLHSQAAKPGNEELAKLVALTLDKMAAGGLYDHLGGGFHRYSTERTWTVPHFEKMLYDQAQLVELYCEAYRRQANPAYKRVIDETLAFVSRELTAPDGYFYSALDADSDGHEGTFYVWSPKQLDEVLGTGPEAKMFRAVYVPDQPNFEGKHVILRVSKPLPEIALQFKAAEPDLLRVIAPLKAKLFDVRVKRNRPFLDTKLITAWNGQMIAAFALAGQALKEPKYTAAATKAADFLLKAMRDKDGRLLRIYAAKPGERPAAKGAAFLDDYAYLTHGLLALHDATADAKWLDAAKAVSDLQAKWFADPDRGGYFTTPTDGEKLFARGKDSYDGAQPSANGVSVSNALRLWQITKDDAARKRVETDLKRNAALLRTQPTAVPVVARVLDGFLASGGAKADPPKKPADPPKKPKDSSDVVEIAVERGKVADGKETFEVKFAVKKGWHIYANPVGFADLAGAQTVVEMLLDGKAVKADVEYPKGKKYKDSSDTEFDVYEGEVVVTVRLPQADAKAAKAVTAKVAISACDDKTCLRPSTVKVDAK